MILGKRELAKQIGATPADAAGIKLRTEVLFLKPDQIDPDPDQPRQEFDNNSLRRLADSLRKYGQLQPALVRKEGARYILVAGERRWRAAKLAGMPNVHCLLCRGGDVRSIQLVENLMREDLLPIEQAKAYKEIMDKEGWKVRELARNLHQEHSKVSKALKLLTLPENVQRAVDAGDLAPTTAYEISKRPKNEHRQLARDAVAGKIKGDDLRQKPAPPPPKPTLLLPSSKPTPLEWQYKDGSFKLYATSFRDKKDLITKLERALASARAARLPLMGGLG